jgi:phage gp29-like protein
MRVIAKPWEVASDDESRAGKKASAMIEAQMKMVNFDQLSLNLLDATLKGIAYGELMWGTDGAETVLCEVKQKSQSRFKFGKQEELRLLTRENILDGVEVPPNKFVVHRFGGRDGSPYGRGLGTILFWLRLFKSQNISGWLLANDKFGNPTAVGKYPKGASADEQRDLLASLTKISQDTGIIIPDGMLVELLEAKRQGSMDTYESLCRYMDEQIDYCVHFQTDSSRSAGGALKAASDNRADETDVLNQADSDLLTMTVDKYIVKPILEYNRIDVKVRPKVYRDFRAVEDLDKRAERDEKIFKMGFEPVDASYVDETYGGKWRKKAAAPAPVVPPGENPLKPGEPIEPPIELAEADESYPDQAVLDAAVDSIPDATNQVLIEAALKPILKLLKESKDGTEALGRLSEIYPLMDVTRLEALLGRCFFIAEVWGRISDQLDPDA